MRQILTFARQADVLFQPLNVSNFMHEVVSMLEETFPQAIEIRRNIERNLPFISADQTQIHQALLNLCVNARDAMPNGGILSIKAETVTGKLSKNGSLQQVMNDMYASQCPTQERASTQKSKIEYLIRILLQKNMEKASGSVCR